MKSKIYFLLSLISIICLIVYPKLIISGCLKGVSLCLFSAIPALFPFILLANFIIEKDIYKSFSKILKPILNVFFKVSENGIFAIIMGFLAGYPMGIKVINHLYTNNLISKKEGNYLSTFCNNTSISFVTSYIFVSCLKSSVSKSLLLFFIYLPPFTVGVINKLYLYKKNISFDLSEDIYNTKQNSGINQIIHSSVLTMCNVCIYIILFSILFTFTKSFIPNFNFKDIILSFTEITNGCNQLSFFNNIDIKIFFICLLTITGGFSVFAQSCSLTCVKSFKKFYILGKLEQSIVYVLIYFLLKNFR